MSVEVCVCNVRVKRDVSQLVSLTSFDFKWQIKLSEGIFPQREVLQLHCT